ncbi:MAG: hypothetical protein KDK76_01430, partial [Chlamydiia bacterium]|nr:hypothetical protein [Chlamydiia bacterium]
INKPGEVYVPYPSETPLPGQPTSTSSHHPSPTPILSESFPSTFSDQVNEVKEELYHQLLDDPVNNTSVEDPSFWPQAIQGTKEVTSWLAHDILKGAAEWAGISSETAYPYHETIDNLFGTQFASSFTPEALESQPEVTEGVLPPPGGSLTTTTKRIAAIASSTGVATSAAAVGSALTQTSALPNGMSNTSFNSSQLQLENQLRLDLIGKGYSTPPRPTGIPESWNVAPTNKNGGVKYFLPTTKKNGDLYNRVEIRVMPANPNSPYEGQRRPYVKHRVENNFYDKNGNIVPEDSLEAHIDYNEYDFNIISEVTQKK